MIKYYNFSISEDAGKLHFENLKTGQTKTVRLVHDLDFIFKVQKSQIKTKYQTADEFLDWMQSLIDSNFGKSHIVTICKTYIGDCDYDFDTKKDRA